MVSMDSGVVPVNATCPEALTEGVVNDVSGVPSGPSSPVPSSRVITPSLQRKSAWRPSPDVA